MLRLIPTPLPESVRNDPLRNSERTVYEAFESHAPTGALIFYSVSWLGRPRPGDAPMDGETDFVVAHPDNGILIIEVKGGKIRYDAATDRWYSNEHRIKDPFDQVKKSKYALLDKIQQVLTVGSGPISLDFLHFT